MGKSYFSVGIIHFDTGFFCIVGLLLIFCILQILIPKGSPFPQMPWHTRCFYVLMTLMVGSELYVGTKVILMAFA